VNLVAVLLTLIGAAILKQEILRPIQMLWINLIMDTFASLALATESPTEDLLDRKPHDRYEYIVSKKMGKHILGQGLLQLIIILIIVFEGDNFIPEYKGDEDKDFYIEEKGNKRYLLNFKYSDS
jgi:Ca2+ transporting ATPase